MNQDPLMILGKWRKVVNQVTKVTKTEEEDLAAIEANLVALEGDPTLLT